VIQYQLKLRPCKKQEQTCDQWLFHLASVHNWAVRKVELNAKDHIYFSKMEFQNLLANHSERLGIPSHTLQGVICTAYDAWTRCFKKLGGKPRLKGLRNKMTSIPFPDPIKPPKGNRITLQGLGSLRFHKMELPEGKIKCGRLVKRASGWYLCLFIDAEPKAIERVAFGEVGIDPGFKNLLTTSVGEVIEHPRELEASAARLAQAQRGHNKRLAARIQERIANQRKDRNHKLTRRLAAENVLIVWSKDNHRGIAKKFGKSVSSSAHAQIRGMLSYKMPKSGGKFIESDSKGSTKTCSECGGQHGPSGFTGLSVRSWTCNGCGAVHDRDVNAARNTFIFGAGYAHESHACA
jgi:putative transposase